MKCDVEPCNCLICKERCSFFSRLDPAELDRVNAVKRSVEFSKGEPILKKGAFNPYVELISGGYVKVTLQESGGKSFVTEVLGPHHFISTNILNEGVNQYLVTALTRAVICYIPQSVFQELLENSGVFGVDFIRYMNQRQEILRERLHSITLKQSRGKLADAILYIDSLNHGGEVFNALSRKDLADMANISMENAIRTLREFEQEGIISTQKKDIAILKRDVLLQISRLG